MPYRISGNCVYVQKAGKWKLLKRHPNHKKALKHFRALKINVKDA